MRRQMLNHPNAIEMSPVLANAYLAQDSLGLAEVAYDRYLEACEPVERALYEDIRLLASPDEYETFAQAPDRNAYLTRFWGDRDPDLTTAANERQLEHYRRVWFARQHFAKAKQPWDTRGEMYVRFGEPDHRSRSDWVNFQQSLAVQRVKEALAIGQTSRCGGGIESGATSWSPFLPQHPEGARHWRIHGARLHSR